MRRTRLGDRVQQLVGIATTPVRKKYGDAAPGAYEHHADVAAAEKDVAKQPPVPVPAVQPRIRDDRDLRAVGVSRRRARWAALP